MRCFMKPDFLTEAETLSREINTLRETIHRRPELGNREFETAALIEKTLRSCGIETTRLLDTAVVGTLRGAKPGKTAALRADMDALPVTEATGCAFASETPGVTHACGHDVHVAAALGAAKLLSAHRDALRGEIKFFFQPDEEGSGGARRMIDAGCMEGVSAVFGCHVSPVLPTGTAGVRYGKFYAASDVFTVTVTGKSAHGAEREKGIDALGAAAEMVTALLNLPAGILPERTVLSVGTFAAGTAENVLADRAEFRGILRTLGPAARRRMKRRMAQTLEAIADKSGATVDLRIRESYGGVVNTDAETRLVRSAAEALLGAENVQVLESPTMTTEDFGCFIDAAGAGCYYHVGAGCAAPLHAPDFLPDGRAAVTAAALHAAVLWDFFRVETH